MEAERKYDLGDAIVGCITSQAKEVVELRAALSEREQLVREMAGFMTNQHEAYCEFFPPNGVACNCRIGELLNRKVTQSILKGE